MLHVVLFEPEIPPNTGNAIRLAANAGATLHVVRPLGFSLSDRSLARAGLDYADLAAVQIHEDWPACRAQLGSRRIYAVSTRGVVPYHRVRYAAEDVLLFGPETRGLPAPLLESVEAGQRIRIPMRPGNRSINLSNAIAIVLYEAWRQNDFAGEGTPLVRKG